MKKNVKVIVNEKPFEVEVGDLNASPVTVIVNGQTYQVIIEAGEVKSAAPVTVRAAAPAPVVKSAPAPISAAKSPVSPAAAGNGSALIAPMPGVILDIAVKEGDKVPYGGLLCYLEAMKMKNAIRAPRDVVIGSVEVQEGQKVAYGDIMFRFA
jgi:biotin carboxyl carrier protein